MHVTLAGNIGVGKTTLAEDLSRSLGWTLLSEEIRDNPYLQPFYNNPREWAFHLQMYNVSRRATRLLEYQNHTLLISDRSFEEDIIYVAVALDRGYISADEHRIYVELHALHQRLLGKPDLLVYIRIADISVLQQRVHQRGREFESQIESSYLAELQARYDEWFASYEGPKHLLHVRPSQPESDKRALVNLLNNARAHT